MNARPFYLVVLVTLFSSCQKLLDYYNIDTNKSIPECRIESINYYDNNNQLSESLEFRYNTDGVLYEAIESYPLEEPMEAYTSVWDYRYDLEGRLIWAGPLSTPRPYATIYAYDGNSRLPARDTLISMGNYRVEYFSYDLLGRIIQITDKYFIYTEEGLYEEHPGDVYRYYYDLRGNRQDDPSNPGYQGLIQYTDKPSLYSLNPVFQLQYKNWSKNSTWIAESYNDKGLPSKTPAEGLNSQPFLSVGANEVINYLCE